MSGEFRSHRFTIQQDRCAMKVSTDGILLGAWANIEKAGSILDIGTGTGLLALMSAQRSPNAMITAIEYDRTAYGQATENVSRSPWADRIKVHCDDIREFRMEIKFDAILCNPPYYEDDLRSPEPDVNMAKHSDGITLKELLEVTYRNLSEKGSAYCIFPLRRKIELLQDAESFGLFPELVTEVCYEKGKAPIRMLVKLSRSESRCFNDRITVQNPDNSYTDQYRELTKDFLLKQGSD